MKELIEIQEDVNGDSRVSGREMHMALGVQTPYDKWFPRMAEYGFTEGKDFSTFLSESTGGRPSVDHLLTIEMAKHIAMIQRTEIGRRIRDYFIECERIATEPIATPTVIDGDYLIRIGQEMKRLNQRLTAAETKIEADAPKVLYAEAVSESKGCVLIRTMAKFLDQNGFPTGEKRFFETLRSDGYLCKSGQSRNEPTQYAMNLGLFRIKETAIAHSDGRVSTTITAKITPKGRIFFVKKYLKRNAVIVDDELVLDPLHPEAGGSIGVLLENGVEAEMV